MTKLVISHYMPEGHGTYVDFILPWTRRIHQACPTLEFEIHSEGSNLGLLENQYDQVLSGTVDIAHSPASLPTNRFPLTNLMNLPFLVKDPQQASNRLWAAYAQYLKREFSPLHVLALHADSGGVLHMRDTQISSLKDFVGKRIRTPSGIIASVLATVGAEPVHLLPPDIEKAAQSGEIDGAIMAWDVLAYTQTQHIFRYHYTDVFYVSPLYLAMNAESRALLTEEERHALDQHSGADLTKRFGCYWSKWSAPGWSLAESTGQVLGALPTSVLSVLADVSAVKARQYVNLLLEDGLTDAAAVEAIFSGRARPFNH